jgi:hypothetical protein
MSCVVIIKGLTTMRFSFHLAGYLCWRNVPSNPLDRYMILLRRHLNFIVNNIARRSQTDNSLRLIWCHVIG